MKKAMTIVIHKYMQFKKKAKKVPTSKVVILCYQQFV